MKLISWNVNGIRAVAKKGFMDWLRKENPDMLCLQETKAAGAQLSDEILNVPDYQSYWCIGERPGYSGTGLYTKEKPVSVEYGFNLGAEFDREGRIIAAEYPGFILLNIYFPNGQKDDARLKYKLAFYDATLAFCEAKRKAGKELIICGDYNTAHNEIDLARPKDNEDVSGFLPVERAWMDKFEAHGYTDTFRKMHPEKAEAYSWWSLRTAARKRNVGWRLDYFYVTPGIWTEVKTAEILSGVEGSDHCPVMVELK